jgi:hypothetical protein
MIFSATPVLLVHYPDNLHNKNSGSTQCIEATGSTLANNRKGLGIADGKKTMPEPIQKSGAERLNNIAQSETTCAMKAFKKYIVRPTAKRWPRDISGRTTKPMQ